MLVPKTFAQYCGLPELAGPIKFHSLQHPLRKRSHPYAAGMHRVRVSPTGGLLLLKPEVIYSILYVIIIAVCLSLFYPSFFTFLCGLILK